MDSLLSATSARTEITTAMIQNLMPATADGTATLIQGQADANGLVEQRIPAGARQGLLSVKVSRDGTETGYSWDLLLGAIDPPSKMTGIQARLNNLGYNTGAVDGIKGQRTTEAIRLFQEKYDLDATGDADQVTREKLVEVHGC